MGLKNRDLEAVYKKIQDCLKEADRELNRIDDEMTELIKQREKRGRPPQRKGAGPTFFYENESEAFAARQREVKRNLVSRLRSVVEDLEKSKII